MGCTSSRSKGAVARQGQPPVGEPEHQFLPSSPSVNGHRSRGVVPTRPLDGLVEPLVSGQTSVVEVPAPAPASAPAPETPEDNSPRVRSKLVKGTKKPETGAFLTFDLLFTTSVNQSITFAWEQLDTRTGGPTAFTDWSDILKFLQWYDRPFLPYAAMWFFATLFLGWFRFPPYTALPEEYGKLTSFREFERVLIPIMICFLVLLYNGNLCIFYFMTPESVAWSSTKSATDTNSKCGRPPRIPWLHHHSEHTVNATVGFFPAEPCNELTWGACGFMTIGHLGFLLTAWQVISFLRKGLNTKDLQQAKETLDAFRWTFLVQIVLHVCALAIEAIAFYGIEVYDIDPTSLTWKNSIGLRTDSLESIRLDQMASFVTASAGRLYWLPYLWMLAAPRVWRLCARCRAQKATDAFLRIDAEYMSKRFETLLKVSFSNVLLAGVQAKFSNGSSIGTSGKYRMSWVHNLAPFALPFLAVGMRMLFIDSMTPSATSSPASGAQIFVHALDKGTVWGLLWMMLNLWAVGISGITAVSVKTILIDGIWADNRYKDLFSLTTGTFVLLSAAVAGCHGFHKDHVARQVRRICLRVLAGLLIMLTAYVCSQFQTLHDETPSRITEVGWIMAMFAPAFLGWFERRLDVHHPSANWTALVV